MLVMNFDTKSPRTHNHQPNYKLRQGIAAASLLVTALIGVKAYETVTNNLADRNTIDDVTFSGVAHTTTNPTEAGKEALRLMLDSENILEVQAASHVDATELGAAITQAVYNETGEDAHSITKNYTVEFKIEADGDVVSAGLQVGEPVEVPDSVR